MGCFVGPDFADAAVAGDDFASQHIRLVYGVAARAHGGRSILLCFGNCAGNLLNWFCQLSRQAMSWRPKADLIGLEVGEADRIARMNCVGCGSASVTERREVTAQAIGGFAVETAVGSSTSAAVGR